MNGWGLSEYVSLLTLIVLAITAGVIIWYSWETRQLRVTTERAREEAEMAREIEFHPWLDGSNLKIDKDTITTIIWLPVKNAGNTPALNVSFDSVLTLKGHPGKSMSYKNMFIAPGDTAHFRIGRFDFDHLVQSAHISVTIGYSTHMNGSGAIRQEFEFSQGKFGEQGGWSNKDGEYTIALSTGQKFPR